ncbi:MAG: Hsp20/alpha crystallin family protein [Chloroflexota bacterium]
MAKSLIRWDPAGEMLSLRDAMDRLLGESFVRPWSGLSTMFGGEGLVLDMYETDDNVMVEANVPGVKPEEIDIQVTGNTLTIKGERKEEKKEEKASYVFQERRYGSFCRTVTLPTDVDVEKATAVFEHGVLKLTLPKSEIVKPKSIKVKTR